MKTVNFIIGLLLAVFVSACVTTQGPLTPVSPEQLKVEVQKACAVMQPTLASMSATGMLEPAQQAQLDQVTQMVGAACAVGGTVDISNLQALVNTSIPAAIKAVGQMNIDDATKREIQVGLIGFQVAVSTAIVQYGPQPAPAK